MRVCLTRRFDHIPYHTIPYSRAGSGSRARARARSKKTTRRRLRLAMYTVYSIISVTRNGRTSPYRHLAIPISPKVSRNRTEQSIMTDPKEWIYLYPTIDRRGFQKERERERERDREPRCLLQRWNDERPDPNQTKQTNKRTNKQTARREEKRSSK